MEKIKQFNNTTKYYRTQKNQEMAKIHPFTRIDMRTINDSRFNPSHLGLMAMLLSQKDGTAENSDGKPFIINKGEILGRMNIKTPFKYKPWDDLEKWGYIISERNGKGTHYIINEIPFLNEELSKKDNNEEVNSLSLTPKLFNSLRNADELTSPEEITPVQNASVDFTHVKSSAVNTTHELSSSAENCSLTTTNIETTTNNKQQEIIEQNIPKTSFGMNPITGHLQNVFLKSIPGIVTDKN